MVLDEFSKSSPEGGSIVTIINTSEEEASCDSDDDTAQQPITWQERRWRNQR